MPLAGKQLLPRQVADHVALAWRGREIVKGVATCLAESQGFAGAWHDNLGADGETVVSRDCGIMQINIPAGEIGTGAEAALRSESLDAAVYGPVVHANFEAALRLYRQPWTRAGKPDERRWEPWAAYTEGWATWTAWFAWSPAEQRWNPTGRYLQRAVAAVANYHAVIAKNWSLEAALEWARTEADFWQLTGSLYGRRTPEPAIVAWTAPARPTVRPADDVGPRPTPNDGS
jgi:hypothetical protein